MKFKLFGTEIYISFLFAALVTLMLATDRTGLILPTFFAVSMHEIGHLFAMWLNECTPKRIKLIPASVQITAPFTKRYKNDILIAVFGPLMNFILFLSLYINYICLKNETVLIFALLNLIIGVFNSLPLYGLDGGTVLKSIIAKYKGPDTAAVALKIITLITAVLIIAAAIVFTVKGKFNLSLFIIGIYLFVMTLANK